MQLEHCEWFLLRDGDEFAIQYEGPHPETEFPENLTGTLATESQLTV